MKTLLRSTLAASFLLASALPVFADARTEAYVQKNASEVLKSLNNPKLTAAERTAAFSTYMDKFTNLDAVSNFVIGKYSRRFTEAELTRYRKAFRTYALTVYEYEVDASRGEADSGANSRTRARATTEATRFARRGTSCRTSKTRTSGASASASIYIC